MIKAVVRALLRRLDLSLQRRLALGTLNNILTTAPASALAELRVLHEEGEWFQVTLEDRIRQINLSGRETTRADQSLRTYLMEDDAPWKAHHLDAIDMPGMISDEEAQYYEWIGQTYLGRGEVIELGPWLGKSTRHIIRGLRSNPKFSDKQLHVYDDFVWRTSWMNQYVDQADRLPNHADFRALFDRFIGDARPFLNVVRAKISDHDGNESLPPIKWPGSPIEIMYVDCGRTMKVNQDWFDTFSPSFMPGITLVVMQDWRLHRERPRKAYNETLWFTQAHPELELIHEVKHGGCGIPFQASPVTQGAV